MINKPSKENNSEIVIGEGECQEVRCVGRKRIFYLGDGA